MNRKKFDGVEEKNSCSKIFHETLTKIITKCLYQHATIKAQLMGMVSNEISWFLEELVSF